jgi:archaellum biogenesis protein FlaJ (TadC family)
MSWELVFFLLILASLALFAVHAWREDERVRSRDQFWREHISKYNKRVAREQVDVAWARRHYENIIKQHNKGDK